MPPFGYRKYSFIHSLIHKIYYALGTLLGAGDAMLNGEGRAP